jgi:hypothetical protein
MRKTYFPANQDCSSHIFRTEKVDQNRTLSAFCGLILCQLISNHLIKGSLSYQTDSCEVCTLCKSRGITPEQNFFLMLKSFCDMHTVVVWIENLQEKFCKAEQNCFWGPGDRLRLVRIHSQWVFSNKNLQSLHLKDSKYILYYEMMVNVNVSDDQQP